ncbi:mitochondrial import inner membrane translocase, subunit timm23 [Gonapodya sp. JEL0774]|nr:mitochondrial import inner membrane translocase, subunit timm23 [Gonapodya sp. JEL0774]
MSADSSARAPLGINPETVSTMLGGIRIDPKTFSPLPPTPDQGLDYLYVDELPLGPPGMPGIPDPKHKAGRWGPLPMRTDGDKMLYGTGAAYISGLGSGGFYGVVRGLQNANATTTRLRINAVLNSTTRYGPWAGNNMGILTLMYTSMDSLFGRYRDKQDYYNHIGAAFTTGLLFKSTAGLRQSLTMGALGVSIVSVYGLVASWSAGSLSETMRAVADAPRQLLGIAPAEVTRGRSVHDKEREGSSNVAAVVETVPVARLDSDNAQDQPFERELHAPQMPSVRTAPVQSGSWLGWWGIGGQARHTAPMTA